MGTTPFSSFPAAPQKKKKQPLTTKGRLVMGLFIALIAVGILFGASELFKGGKGKGSSPSSGSTSGFSSLVSKFSSSKADITVCVVTWGGYAGGEYYNGSFKASKDSRYYQKNGMTVEFKVIDDFPPSRDAWRGDSCQVIWTTADSEVTEVIGLRDGGYDPKIFFQSDWSRGGDVFVASVGIKSIQDLRGKRVSFLPNSPSNTLLLNALDAAGMTIKDIDPVETQGAPQSAEAFKSGNVDAAIVWSPDDADCLQKVPGSHVLMSSRQASNIIADVFYAKEKFIDAHLDQLTGLVEGWLTGAAEINTDPAAKAKAIDILTAGFSGVDKAFVTTAINNVRLTTFGDNLNFFGLNPDYKGVKGEDLYAKMTRMYTVAGKVSGIPPAWRSIVDLRVLQNVKLQATGANAAEGTFTFTAPTSATITAPALASKGLSVTFATGSYTLDENAKVAIDLGATYTLKGFSNERVRVEGNTDDVGNHDSNVSLSKKRAKAVADYLIQKYGFDPNRFVYVGNGPDRPVCTDDSADCRAKNRRTDFQLVSN